MKVSLGTLKNKGDELVAFLEPRVGAKPSLSGDTIELDDGSLRQGVRPRQVKTYIKRFLYMNGVRKNYRVFVSGKDLTLQEIELGGKKEEEKESPKAEAPEALPTKEPEAAEAEAKPEDETGEMKAKPKKAAAKKPKAKKKPEAES
ncbi:MAG: hypothetical protein HY297_00470 [Thaumarchaeota archaeon]|nr:hypothetical protein [Nitrososphaerota archaeon]